MTTEIAVGQVFRDIDRGHCVRIRYIATPESDGVDKPIAACYSKGKLTAIAIERLSNPARYELVPQEN